jgi:hypothetical protein
LPPARAPRHGNLLLETLTFITWPICKGLPLQGLCKNGHLLHRMRKTDDIAVLASFRQAKSRQAVNATLCDRLNFNFIREEIASMARQSSRQIPIAQRPGPCPSRTSDGRLCAPAHRRSKVSQLLRRKRRPAWRCWGRLRLYHGGCRASAAFMALRAASCASRFASAPPAGPRLNIRAHRTLAKSSQHLSAPRGTTFEAPGVPPDDPKIKPFQLNDMRPTHEGSND